MSSAIVHPTAIVAEDAILEDGVRVGAYAIVGRGVRLGKRTELRAHAIVERETVMGEDNLVCSFAVLGGDPQDKRWNKDTKAQLVVGDRNVFREHVTVNRGSAERMPRTRIGSDCLLMASVHVGHDAFVANHVQLANATLVAGHVAISDYVVTGGGVAIQPFVTVGERAFLAGGAMVERNVPPFVIASGDRARVRTLNVVGLERSGVPVESRKNLERAFKTIFRGGEPRIEAAKRLADDSDPFVALLAKFVASAG